MPDNSFLFTHSPLWRSHDPILDLQTSAEMQSWLYESGSLTKRLRAVYGSSFGVKVLFHCWKTAFIDESRLLNISRSRYQLIREVLLHADGNPLVVARTVIPEQTIKISRSKLSHLGNRPLGEVIFAYPDLERRLSQYSRAETGIWTPCLKSALTIEQAVWGRRTLYAIHQQPMLVAEFFLPGILGC